MRVRSSHRHPVELLAQNLPDLVILDIRLPGASGSEVLRRIRTDPATAALPAMYLSATYADEASIAQGLTEGADAYLTKPVAPAVLLGQVAARRVGRVKGPGRRKWNERGARVRGG
jgi:CheY-like chemotaxis protein